MENESTRIAAWIEESRFLREKLAQLETALRDRPADVTSIDLQELVELKNNALTEYAALIEEKMRGAEETARLLNQRNDELQNSLAVLQLYQMIFENEPAGIVGVDRQGRIIQFNSSAIRYFGVGLHALRLQQVGQLHLEGVGDALQPDFAALFASVIDSHSDASMRVTADLGRIYVRCYRLEDCGGLRGVVVRAIAEAEDGGASTVTPRVVLSQNQ